VIDEQLIGALHLSSARRGEGPLDKGEEGHRAFQASTLSALLDGVYDGDMTIAELARRGDLGIGTLNGCDGELTAIDGRFLRADASGAISPVPPEARTPFAVLTFFQPRHRLAGPPGADFDGLCAAIDRVVGEEPIVHAIRIEGSFESLQCRSVPKQSKPYRPLAEVLADQCTFELRELSGTIVGFRFPNLGLGIGVPGYHLHFVSSDRRRGGHLLDCRSGPEPARIEVDDLADLHVETPPGVEIAGNRVEQSDVDALERSRE
jgi:acetolactate decarboxylase